MSSESVNSNKTYRYRLYPTRAQETALNVAMDTLRHVYNSLLNERKFLYETTGESPSQYDQEKHFAPWRKEFPKLAHVHSHLLQNAALRVNLAFSGFFRRVKEGDTPGYPRFKGPNRYDSLTFKEWGNGVSFKNGNLYLSKVGEVKGKFHRPTQGTPKTATIRRQAGKWFVCIACEVAPEPLPPSEGEIGIDVGLKTFAALSDGSFIENPRFFRKDEKALAKAQRKLAKQNRGAHARKKARKVVSRIHERVRNRRHDFVHQTARRIVNGYGVIAVEKLNVQSMSRRPKAKPDPSSEGCFLPNGTRAKAGLNKSIADASWSLFRQCLTYKAESAGRELHAVDPAYTSQDCHACGCRAKKNLPERWHLCPVCGASLDRDTNAAINILSKRPGTTGRGRYTGQEAAGL